MPLGFFLDQCCLQVIFALVTWEAFQGKLTDNFNPREVTMRPIFVILVAVVVLLPLIANATDVEGDVWGTWTKENSPYNVIGEIRVPPESTLVIESGVTVAFQGHYKFIVDSLATLLAVASESDSIFFTCDTLANPDRWHGIRLIYADSNSQISYCRLEYGTAIGTNEDRNGGAIYCYHSNPAITNNTMKDNWVSRDGGGVYCMYSSPTISNNSISVNSATNGGAICCIFESSPLISSNAIISNSAEDGGGICCYEHSNPLINRNTIRDNSAGRNGGGISCDSYCNPVISHNAIQGNSSVRDGGGIDCEDSSNPAISNNTISENLADSRGGGINCYYDSNPAISNNTITGNSAIGTGAGICCRLYSAPTIDNNIISRNSAPEAGGGIASYYASPTINNNTIFENSAGTGGGIWCYMHCSPTITIGNNIISRNSGLEFGGGIACHSSSPTINNNTISENSAGAGGGVWCSSSSPTINNNTISENSAGTGGGIWCRLYSGPTIINTILWGDTAPNAPEIYLATGSNPTVTYCDVEGGWEGEGNIDVDPLFRDPEAGDFHLMADYCGDPYNSPCIDAGHPDSLDVLLDCFHGLGADRADMGAYGGRNSGWPTGIEDDEDNIPIIPRQFLLLQNYPNPFNASTVIEYQVPVHGHVKLEIYNLFGQKVATLVDSKQQAGYRTVLWDASRVSSGLYFYKLTAGDFSETRRMMLVK
jgi:parallel beta-helix repeat protein